MGAQPSNKLSKCVCVYIHIYIYLYLCLSLSYSPANRGRANSQARGLDGRACLRGAPLLPLGTPRHALKHSPRLQKWFLLLFFFLFFLAYILQQYHNTLLTYIYRDLELQELWERSRPRPCLSGGRSAGTHCLPVWAGRAEPGWAAAVPQEPGSCLWLPPPPRLTQGPSWPGGGSKGHHLPCAIVTAPREPDAQLSSALGSRLPAQPVLPTMASGC